GEICCVFLTTAPIRVTLLARIVSGGLSAGGIRAHARGESGSRWLMRAPGPSVLSPPMLFNPLADYLPDPPRATGPLMAASLATCGRVGAVPVSATSSVFVLSAGPAGATMSWLDQSPDLPDPAWPLRAPR